MSKSKIDSTVFGPRLLNLLESGESFINQDITISLDLSPASILRKNQSNWRTVRTKIKHLKRRIYRYQKPLIDELIQKRIDVRESIWLNNKLRVRFTRDSFENFTSLSFSTYAIKRISYIELPQKVSISKLGSNFNEPINTIARDQPSNLEIGAKALWDKGYTGERVRIALLDSGIKEDHPSYSSRLWNGKTDNRQVIRNGHDCLHGYNFVDDNIDLSDTMGHGTCSAGILVGPGCDGTTPSISPESTLMVLKIAKDYDDSLTTDLICWKALQFAADNDVDIIVFPYSVYYSDHPDVDNWRITCNTLYSLDKLVVCAAGNDGESISQHSPRDIPYNVGLPASCPPPVLGHEQRALRQGGVSSVIACGAALNDNSLDRHSSRGPSQWPDYPDKSLIKPDICGPSEGVISCSRVPDNPFSVVNNCTSASTPHVAGAIALLLDAARKTGRVRKPLPDIIRLLMDNATLMTGQNSRTVNNAVYKADNGFGAGKVNVFAAYQAGINTLWR